MNETPDRWRAKVRDGWASLKPELLALVLLICIMAGVLASFYIMQFMVGVVYLSVIMMLQRLQVMIDVAPSVIMTVPQSILLALIISFSLLPKAHATMFCNEEEPLLIWLARIYLIGLRWIATFIPERIHEIRLLKQLAKTIESSK